MSQQEFKKRNQMLVESLRENDNVDIQTAASIVYEQQTGNELVRETDPENGEDYRYKSDELSGCASLRVHPEVVEFFNWRNGLIQSGKDEGLKLAFSDIESKQKRFNNLHAADLLEKDFEDFQADN